MFLLILTFGFVILASWGYQYLIIWMVSLNLSPLNFVSIATVAAITIFSTTFILDYKIDSKFKRMSFALPLIFPIFFANIYQNLNCIQNVSLEADYLYFSIVTWTTLGYGDLLPVENCRLIAASQALIGYFALAILVAISYELNSRYGKKL